MALSVMVKDGAMYRQATGNETLGKREVYTVICPAVKKSVEVGISGNQQREYICPGCQGLFLSFTALKDPNQHTTQEASHV